jgi:hypothetical protein
VSGFRVEGMALLGGFSGMGFYTGFCLARIVLGGAEGAALRVGTIPAPTRARIVVI